MDGEGPQLHSYHCLLDVAQCIANGFEMLEAPQPDNPTTYCRILRFDEAGDQMQTRCTPHSTPHSTPHLPPRRHPAILHSTPYTLHLYPDRLPNLY